MPTHRTHPVNARTKPWKSARLVVILMIAFMLVPATQVRSDGPLQLSGLEKAGNSTIRADAPPASPQLQTPASGDMYVNASPGLSVIVSDPDGSPLDVTFYGRPKPQPAPSDFTLVALPDTQNYTANLNGGTAEMFSTQTRWVVSEQQSRNIAYVTHLGDISELGDHAPSAWKNADAAMSILDVPLLPKFPSGIPYGMILGNHDFFGGNSFYDRTFGAWRFSGRGYYGGNDGTDNHNHFDIFSAGGLDFIVVSLSYNPSGDALAWADAILKAHRYRRAIVTSHDVLISTGENAQFSPNGSNIYEALKDNPNLFLILCGHTPGEGWRQDVFEGRTITTILTDYQWRANGGDGWLRLYEFSPANYQIRVRTYSPMLDAWETDGDSEFTIVYNMAPEFAVVGAAGGVPSGGLATVQWYNLTPNNSYEWYAVASDGSSQTQGPIWDFTVNQVAVTVSDFYITLQDTPLAVPAPWLLANDLVQDAGAMVAVMVSYVQNGQLVFNESGAFVYTPNAGFVGLDSFTYLLIDGARESNTVMVKIQVQGR